MIDSRLSSTRVSVRWLVIVVILAGALLSEVNAQVPALLAWATVGTVAVLFLGGPLTGLRIAAAGVAGGLYASPQAYPLISQVTFPRDPNIWLPLVITILSMVIIGMVSRMAARSVEGLGVPQPSGGTEAPPGVDAGPAPPEQGGVTNRLQALVAGEIDQTVRKPSGDRADEVLEQEMQRSRRYGHSFSLMMLEVEGAANIDPGARDQTYRLEKLLSKEFRGADTIVSFGNGRFGVILPETPSDRAAAAAERVCKILQTAVGLRSWSGIAEYPTDADNKQELIAEAEAARRVAGLAGIAAASRSLVA